jgi:ABC-type polysaccharide/polyol phosphate transport system ATPase subunit
MSYNPDGQQKRGAGLAVRAKNLSKSYRIFPGNKARLKQIFFQKKKYYEEFWALRDINLELRQGEALGVIGLNGAGKSTLLQLMASVIKPSSGHLEVNGRISALLELGTGFNSDFTGRENVILNGVIMGFSRKQMLEKMEEIRQFADIGEFFDQPLKTYSSGMRARLGFAVAVNLNPDILLVDEVLSVGDFQFQQKCLEKIHDMLGRMSVLLVSHSMSTVSRFCNRTIVLDKGRKLFEGDSAEAIGYYLDEVKGGKADSRAEAAAPKAFQGEIFENAERICDVTHHWVNENGEATRNIKHGGEITLEFSFRLLSPVRNLSIGIPIWDATGNLLTAVNSDACGITFRQSDDGIIRGRMRMAPVLLNPGRYHSVLAIHEGTMYLYRNVIEPFYVEQAPLRLHGFFTMPSEWVIE